jgi:hypothetical protein
VGYVTTKQVEKYLDRRGWKNHQAVPEPGEKEGMVLTGWRAMNGDSYRLIIDPSVEKNCLVFRVTNIINAKPDSTPADRLSGLLMTMGFLNYELLLGGWVYDPRDGEVAFKVGVPIDDGSISYEEFQHCMMALIMAVEVDAGNLKAIVDGSRTAIDVLSKEGATIG